jgi:hypothetical protein
MLTHEFLAVFLVAFWLGCSVFYFYELNKGGFVWENKIALSLQVLTIILGPISMMTGLYFVLIKEEHRDIGGPKFPE